MARTRLTEHGPNHLAEAQRNTAWPRLQHQLADAVVVVLRRAAGVSVAVGESESANVEKTRGAGQRWKRGFW